MTILEAKTQTVIVGAGLCGLSLANALIEKGQRVVVLEGRERVGGRILSCEGDADPGHRYDLGPAWIWPHNRRMLKLLERLNMQSMPQYASGRLAFEDAEGQVRRDLNFSTMGNALRLPNGLARIPEAMASGLPAESLRLEHRVRSVTMEGASLRVEGMSPSGGFSIAAERTIFALPPRLVGEGIVFDPPLSKRNQSLLTSVPTWMAGHGKAMMIYPEAFWRNAGLSGDGISHRGPLMEIHDASPVADPVQEAALFGFVHPEWLKKSMPEAELKAAILSQLVCLFGPEAERPSHMTIKRWAMDGMTATPADRAPVMEHPSYRPVSLGESEWAGLVILSGSETAVSEGGYLEGALEAAEATLLELKT